MQNGDIELNGYLMGAAQPVFATLFEPRPGKGRVQDQDSPYGPTRIFGRDVRGAGTLQLEFSLGEKSGQNPDTGVLDVLEELAAAWDEGDDRPGGLARTPGAVTGLRYMIGGRIRRIYGRPRNFSYTASANITAGNIVATAEFERQDLYYYSDTLNQLDLQMRQQPTGWVTLPAVWPVISVISATRQGLLDSGSKVAAIPEDITFYGPVINPTLTHTDWKVGLNAVIPYDGWIRVNPRDRTVLDQAGASRAGDLTRETFIPDLRIRPGAQDLTFTGGDNTATSRAVVRWRTAYRAL